MAYFQQSLFGKTSWERFHQITGWILELFYPLSQTPMFQCLLLEDGQEPEWCEGERPTSAGGSWTPSIGQAPGWHDGSASFLWQTLEDGAPTKYFLSPAQCSHFLHLAEIAGCPPPAEIRSTGRGSISADDDLAVEKLTKKLEGMESQQAMMKAANAYYRKHKTLEGCPELTAEQVEKVKASMSQDWRKDPVPFPSYLLTNNNANIRRVRQRIEDLSHKAEFVGWTFPGGEAKVNEAENRLQLIFEDKPDTDTRQALKSEGFKWAPSQGAWQRQLNQNAIRAAARLDFLRPEDGKIPYQFQPFAKRAEKDVSR